MRYLSLLVLVLFSFAACNKDTVSQEPNSQTEAATQADVSADLTPIEQLLASSDKPAVVKFYAEWCSTCKNYEPRFQEVKAEMGEEVDFISVDVDEKQYKPLLKQLKISRIPETAFISTDRKNITKKLGSISSSKLKKLIKKTLLI